MHRVLHVIPSLRWSPAERQLRIVLKCGSDSWQHQICMLRNRPGEESSWAPPASVRQMRFANRLDLVGLRRLRTAIREFRPKIVHAWSPDTLLAVRIASAGLPYGLITSEFTTPAKKRAAAGLTTALGLVPPPPYWRGYRRLIPSWCEAQHDASKPHQTPGVTMVDYGVELIDDPAQRRAARDRLCQRLELPEQAKLVGFLGEFTIEQRLKDAIWAADLLKVVRDDLHLVLAGSGPHFSRLKRFRHQVQILDRVHFVHDPSLFDETLSAFDVCWVTGQSDLGTPLLLEAMARGIPVIVSDTPSHRKLVMPDVTGLLFEVGHRAGLARLTHQLVDDRARAESLGRSARDQLATACSAANVATAYDQIYERVAAAGWGGTQRR